MIRAERYGDGPMNPRDLHRARGDATGIARLGWDRRHAPAPHRVARDDRAGVAPPSSDFGYTAETLDRRWITTVLEPTTPEFARDAETPARNSAPPLQGAEVPVSANDANDVPQSRYPNGPAIGVDIDARLDGNTPTMNFARV